MTTSFTATRIGDVSKHVTVGFVGSMATLFTATGVPLLRGQNVQAGRLDLTNLKFVSRETHLKWKKSALLPGDVVLVRVGYPGTAAVIPEGVGDLNAASLVIVRPDQGKVAAQYLCAVLNSPWGKSRIAGLLVGSAQQVLNTQAVADLEVPLPDLASQQRIAGILSAYDDLIENCERRIRVLDEMARALYREWFVDFRFPGAPGENQRGGLPNGWCARPLGETCVNFDRLRRPLSKTERADRPGPYPYYGAAKVFDFIDDFIFDGQYLLLAEDGSVATADGHPVLQITRGKFWPNNHTHVLQGRDVCSTFFLYLSLSGQSVAQYVTGAAQPKITQENLNRMPVVCGPADVHQAFDRITGPMLDQMQCLEWRVQNLRATRDLLLPRLLSGQLSVDDAA